MMTSMAQPFAGHQAGMSAHAGVAHGGHPMAQGHPSNQGVPGGGQQPGVSMGQQMHAGVTGPGGPQVTQAGPMMGGMMQGGGPPGVSGGGVPSAHALSHLTPGQGQVFVQQQQQQQHLQQASKHLFSTFLGISSLHLVIEMSTRSMIACSGANGSMPWLWLCSIRFFNIGLGSTEAPLLYPFVS